MSGFIEYEVGDVVIFNRGGIEQHKKKMFTVGCKYTVTKATLMYFADRSPFQEMILDDKDQVVFTSQVSLCMESITKSRENNLDIFKAMEKVRDKREYVMFHGYRILRDSTVIAKCGKKVLKTSLRERNGGGFDKCISLSYRGKRKKWTLQRLIAACFDGPIDGYEINHKDRDTMNNHINNLERLTPKQNQKHWRDDEKRKNLDKT